MTWDWKYTTRHDSTILIIDQLIGPPTELSNLPSGAGEGGDVAHPDHGGNEVGEESLRVVAVGFDEGVGGGAAEEDLIGM